MRVFDIHVHFGLGGDEFELLEVPARADFARRVDAYLAELPGGVEGANGALLPPMYYALPGGVEDTRRLNDLVAAVRAAAPGRFPAAFGVVEPHHAEAALAEIDRIAGELGLAGLVFSHRAHGAIADVAITLRCVERAAARGLLPMLHATPFSGNEALWRVWRVAEMFADVPIVALGALSNFDQTEQILANPERAPNLRYDTSGVLGSFGRFERLAERLGPHRLVYGSGAHDRRAAARAGRQFIAILESALPEDVKVQILWGNAAALLKLATRADA
jgi:predicted TIM-barrel fold metal-dependent hydrolase